MIEPTMLERATLAIRALVESIVNPRLLYLGEYEIKVTGVSGTATAPVVSGVPTDAKLGLPPTITCAPLTGLLAEVCTPTVGTMAYIRFINGDPTRARLVAADSIDAGTMAKNGAPAPIARLGDQVISFLAGVPFQFSVAPTFTGSTGLVAGATPVTMANGAGAGPVYLIAVQPVTGIINGGSSKANCG